MFLVACCTSLFDPATRGAIAEQVRSVDFANLMKVAKRHRVEGLLWNALRSAGIETDAPELVPLAAAACAIAQQGLRASTESARIQSVFAAAGVDLLFLKGLAIGQLAYGNAFVKMSWDIDVMVAPDDVGRAANLIEALNYRCVTPAGDRASFERWHVANKESVWQSDDGLRHVELHSRLTDNPRLIPTIDMDSPRQMVVIVPGIALPTLATDELFAYLCVHGASSAWFRLKWVTDFAGLLSHRDAVEIERLYRSSQSLGAARAAAQALMVTDALFGLPLSTGLREELGRSVANRWLAAAALRELASPREPTARPLGTVMIHLTQLLLKPDASFHWHELRRQVHVALATR